ncbi:hypothetical protein [Phenylobacterium sp.]|jgi:hypothetical protein|uniref:hypothetical protein n=1 Tax=Phenylobacterium sp. TaxID=1871053 RepID=UPI002F3E8C54
MVLSNAERQALYRARRRVNSEALARLLTGWAEQREGLMRQIEALESSLRTRANNVGGTTDALARVREHIAGYDRLIAEITATEGDRSAAGGAASPLP